MEVNCAGWNFGHHRLIDRLGPMRAESAGKVGKELSKGRGEGAVDDGLGQLGTETTLLGTPGQHRPRQNGRHGHAGLAH